MDLRTESLLEQGTTVNPAHLAMILLKLWRCRLYQQGAGRELMQENAFTGIREQAFHCTERHSLILYRMRDRLLIRIISLMITMKRLLILSLVYRLISSLSHLLQ